MKKEGPSIPDEHGNNTLKKGTTIQFVSLVSNDDLLAVSQKMNCIVIN